MRIPQDRASALKALKTPQDAFSQLSALSACANLPLSPGYLLRYHDLLLFTLAWPFNNENYLAAASELERLTLLVKKNGNDDRWRYSLEGSGISYTILRCQFSLDLAGWLINRFPDDLSPDSCEAENGALSLLLQSLLPAAEFYKATQESDLFWRRLQALSGHYRNRQAIAWLIKTIMQQPFGLQLKDILYDNLKLFLRWEINDPLFSRSFIRAPFASVRFRETAAARADALTTVAQKIGRPVSMNATLANRLIETARVVMACYYRETDPFTYADPEETSYYDMGEGTRIALYGMIRDRKLALESYIGFMAFRNGIPVAYGGGWIFGYRCKIGVNIFPPFRGVGSDHLFCQVMRVYHQVYGVKRFIVKPYQFGKGNPEGLKSGAFWFYYRLGFRPVNPSIATIAAQEWDKINMDRTYRTPIGLLRHFTGCNKEWTPWPEKKIHPEADRLSVAVTKMVCEEFNSDRKMASAACRKQLREFLGKDAGPLFGQCSDRTMDNWSLMLGVLCDDQRGWTIKDRKAMAAIIRLRYTGPETEYIKSLQKHRLFWKKLDQLA